MIDQWWKRGACRGMTSVFFPELGGSARVARDICRLCPVRQRCLDYAIDHHEMHGVWGGASFDDRTAIVRARAASA